MNLVDIDTPSVLIDLDILDRNIRRMHAHLSENGIAIRPHVKHHKIPAIAHMQMRAGAVGITCQKLSEAEVMAAAGLDDILVAFNIVGRQKLERLARLMCQTHMSVIADSEAILDGLSMTAKAMGKRLDVLVEYDISAQRSGVRTAAEAVALARSIARRPDLHYRGLMSFRGYSPDLDYIKRTSTEFQRVSSDLRADGIETEVISSGGTVEAWTAWPDHSPWGVNECRPGLYTFYDRVKVDAGVAELADCALRVLATVVSRPTPSLAVVDAGEKTLTESRYRFGAGEGCGYVVEYPDGLLNHLWEEHGVVDLSGSARAPKVGERVTIIPNYSSLVTNLANEVYGVRGNRVEAVWPVAARGCVR